ncbi:MAG: cupin domain-containing protein [Deltaproteobacteria bacterium]|nr:cupin domain-containing protein [Deltaproteobacteria bacterium]
MEKSPVIRELSAMTEFAKEGIVSKTVVSEDYGKVVFFCMAKGQTLSEHTASRPASVHIIEGKGKFMLGNDWFDVTRDTWILMPPHTKHAVTAEEDMVFLLTLFTGGK